MSGGKISHGSNVLLVSPVWGLHPPPPEAVEVPTHHRNARAPSLEMDQEKWAGPLKFHTHASVKKVESSRQIRTRGLMPFSA